jgi:poly(hydroxyalkanoate) depolymerase family esterase
MPGLGETVEKLSHLKRKLLADAEGAAVGEGRMRSVRGFGFNPGALSMLTYVPEHLPPGAPLVVVLHGCTQRAEAHAAAAGWLTLADRLGFVVLAPEQAPANNANRCFNWFEPEDARRGGGEAASINAMVAHSIKQHGLDPSRVFVTGLSAGGAMAAVMLATYPEVFAAGAVIAGLPYGAATNMHEAMALMHGPQDLTAGRLGALVRAAAPEAGRLPRISIWHGDVDWTVNHRNAADAARQWAEAHGLPAQPDEVQALRGRVRSIWRAPGGEPVIESNLVRGLGHGVPLAAGGEDGLGAPGPYMLEAGISSSLEIARFWGLAPPAPAEEAIPLDAAAADAPAATPGIAGTVMSALNGHVSSEVEATIARALKMAGLM